MKSFFSTKKSSAKPAEDEPVSLSLKKDLEHAIYALETAYMGFENATDPDLIDCYIYEVNAVMKRYCYLLHQVNSGKESSIT